MKICNMEICNMKICNMEIFLGDKFREWYINNFTL